jgi:uncharacterized protein (UPF0548 family)
MIFSKPEDNTVKAFLEREQLLPFSYEEVGATRSSLPVKGFDNDLNTILLGEGNAAWEAAKAAILRWKMFPGGWACIWPDAPTVIEGTTVVMLARVLGIWWKNSCRIVYTIDEPQRFGFAYGTLPGHAECGEELFLVEKWPDGTVHYILKAFSKPRFWMARLAYPIARWYQKAFVHASKASMKRFVQANFSKYEHS